MKLINTNIMRHLLWAGVIFNALVALMLMFPSTLGAMAALPPIGSVFYSWMLTFFVMLFSATYAWLAIQPTIPRPVIALAAIGKTGAFFIALVCFFRGDIQLRALSISVGDLAFSIYFFLWLRATAVTGSNA